MAMPSRLVAVLLSIFCCWTVVSGDCYDEPPNNKTYNNCATCYQTFANALVNTADNKFRMSKAFFPIFRVKPVEVETTYRSTSNETQKLWYWLMGGYYVFQPLELFIYRSLLFSPPTWRQETLTVYLPDECFSDNELFFEFATQRVSRYAQTARLQYICRESKD